MKPLKHVLVMLTLSLLIPAAPAGTFSINAWTDDASSGIVAGQTVWAYHFGVTNIATVNGVTVPGVGTNGNPAVPGQFSVTNIPFVFLGDGNNLTALGGSGSAVMAGNFIYGGMPGLLAVQGLTTGQVYTVSIYGVGHESPPVTRASNFTNGTDHIYVDENSLGIGNGVRVDYTFTATAATNLTIVMPTNTSTFHTYALALRQPLLVTTTSDAGPGSLRQAVLDAATLPGTNTITFAPALSGATITLASQITITNAVTIDASALTGGVQISGGNSTRVFYVTNGAFATLKSLTIANGLAPSGVFSADGGGGAIFCRGRVDLLNCSILNNTVVNLPLNSFAGGIGCDHGDVQLTGCTLTGNSAATAGGAIYNYIGTLTMTNCTLAGNSSEYGGAMVNNASTLTLTHCTFTFNRSTGTSPSFDGGGAIDLFGGGTRTMNGCILAGNTAATGTGPDFWMEDGTVNANNCLVGNGNNSTLANGVNGNQVGTSGTPINALLAPLGNYGGQTQTMPPLPGSPAIDAASLISGLTTDQRGSARVVGTAPDIGAVESGGLWVENQNNTDPSSLRGVILSAASVTNSKTILFAPNLSGATITLGSEIVLSNNVAIDATSLPGGITVSGGNVTRIFTVNSNQSVSMSGLALTGGNGVGVINSGNGSAIENDGTLRLDRCTISANSGIDGGAIHNVLGKLILNECSLFGNQVGNGGGGALYNLAGSIELINCTLSTNSAPFGGAIVGFGGTLTLTHCTLALNHATYGTYGGGAIDNYNSGTLTMTACMLAGNTVVVTANGPDLWMENGTLNATNCLIGNGTDSTLVNGVNGNLVGTGGSPINALLATLGNYGGPTQTMPPLPGSPAINAAGASSFAIDQRGYPRPAGLAADIGAVEGIYNAAGPGNITGITQLGNGSVRLSFTNLTDASFPVLATTNLSQSVGNWTVAGYAGDTAAGTNLIQFTDADAAKYPQRFYRVQSP